MEGRGFSRVESLRATSRLHPGSHSATSRVVITEHECWAFGLRKNVKGENVISQMFPRGNAVSGFRSSSSRRGTTLKRKRSVQIVPKVNGEGRELSLRKHCNVCFTFGKTYFGPE